MITTDAALRSLVDGLLDAIGQGRWEEADADLETLVQEALAGILEDRAADLALIARLTAGAHTALTLRGTRGDGLDGGLDGGLDDGLGDGRSDGLGAEAMHRLGQLRAVALLAAAGRSRRRPRPLPVLAGTESPGAALLAALEDGAQTGQELVAATGLKPETVARALPELRAAGLVRSWPAGRLVVNERV